MLKRLCLPLPKRNYSLSQKWKQGFPDDASMVKEGVYNPHDKTANRKMEKIKNFL
jgi:hypothetical protein